MRLWQRVGCLCWAIWIVGNPIYIVAAVNPDYGRTPVLFVHGHGLYPSDWREIIAHLIGIGYPKEYLYAVEIVPNNMANVQAAITVIAPAAESLLKKAEIAARVAGYQDKPPRQLDIVSHSMGAVSSRWYVAKLRPDRVRTWISLAGANHGTKALCPYPDDAAKEMCQVFATTDRESAVQVALNGTPKAPLDETPFGVGRDRAGINRVPPDDSRSITYFSMRIEPDAWIKPERSAILDGAGGIPVEIPSGVPVVETSPGNYLFQGKEGLFQKDVDHCSILIHSDLLRFVVALLAVNR